MPLKGAADEATGRIEKVAGWLFRRPARAMDGGTGTMLRTDFSAVGAHAFAQGTGTAGRILYHREDGIAHGLPGRAVTIGLAAVSGDRDRAECILNRAYGKRGYGSNHRIARTGHSVTFTASTDGRMIGTLTLSVDSPDRLSVQATFPEDIERLRAAPGASLCELTKFAFDPAPDSRPLLAALFHIIFIYGTQRFDCTELLIEVNPRHVRFYEVMLGFTKVGPLRTNRAVEAPAQLMILRVADIRRHIDDHAGIEGIAGHSLYRYFFDRSEQRVLEARIARLPGKSNILRFPSVALDLRRRLFGNPIFRGLERKRAAA